MSETTPAPARRGRPPASSREQIEAVALELFVERGFTETTLASITAAARVSKTSFFRYYPSKGDIIWAPFEEYSEHLASLLEAGADGSGRTMDLVRGCIVEALAVRIDPGGQWLRRFAVIEASVELRAGESRYWSAWTTAVAGFVADRHGLVATDVVPQSVAGAVHAAYLSVLRSWLTREDLSPALAGELDERLAVVTDALQAWVETVPPQTSLPAQSPAA